MWHLFLGVLLNVFGTAIMFVSNSWLTYQTSPAIMGPDHKPISLHDESGAFIGTLWQAVNNFTWMPVNIHRLIGNIAFGGAIVGAYAAFRFLAAKTQEDKAHYDWMGYTGNFIALCGLIPLPVRRILARAGNLYVQQHHGHQHDGKPFPRGCLSFKR